MSPARVLDILLISFFESHQNAKNKVSYTPISSGGGPPDSHCGFEVLPIFED